MPDSLYQSHFEIDMLSAAADEWLAITYDKSKILYKHDCISIKNWHIVGFVECPRQEFISPAIGSDADLIIEKLQSLLLPQHQQLYYDSIAVLQRMHQAIEYMPYNLKLALIIKTVGIAYEAADVATQTVLANIKSQLSIN
jgi:hypothetical protein